MHIFAPFLINRVRHPYAIQMFIQLQVSSVLLWSSVDFKLISTTKFVILHIHYAICNGHTTMCSGVPSTFVLAFWVLFRMKYKSHY